MALMTKEEADKKCMKLFGMSSDDYAKHILDEWEKEQRKKEEEVKTA